MGIQATGVQAYSNIMNDFKKIQDITQNKTNAIPKNTTPKESFAETFKNSLSEVNELQTEKAKMIQSFASGENQNVHELMITLQKAGLAINMTSAIRNKVLEGYKELSKLQF